MALQRFGNDVEMACQALLSAGALGQDAGVGEGHAAAEEGHDPLAGTSDDAGGMPLGAGPAARLARPPLANALRYKRT
jgi:hypothetical protein